MKCSGPVLTLSSSYFTDLLLPAPILVVQVAGGYLTCLNPLLTARLYCTHREGINFLKVKVQNLNWKALGRPSPRLLLVGVRIYLHFLAAGVTQGQYVYQ